MALINGTENDDFSLYGTAGDDQINGFGGSDLVRGGGGNDIIDGGSGVDFLDGDAGNDTIYGGDAGDVINGGEGNDVLYGGTGGDRFDEGGGNDIIDGGTGDDWVRYDYSRSEVTIRHSKTGGVLIIAPDGIDTLINVESAIFNGSSLTNLTNLAPYLINPNYTSSNGSVASQDYTGPVTFLEFQFLGDATSETVTASSQNDFLNLLGGNDAANGGLGDDVLDGGTGSNFLTGGGDNDTFFLDGRGGTITWSTITDFVSGTGAAGDEVNIWGWSAGTSRLLLSQENGGVSGFTGATLHYDLNGDSTIDTSITFTGLSLAQVPNALALNIAGNGYLLIA